MTPLATDKAAARAAAAATPLNRGDMDAFHDHGDPVVRPLQLQCRLADTCGQLSLELQRLSFPYSGKEG
jgi:hypothetical protein